MEPNAVIQCSPNFSEGRRPDVIEAIVLAIQSCGVKILSVAPDMDHNRTVVAFVGGPQEVATAAVRGADIASRLIDLNHHRGSHPRMGATDVIPFVPISGCEMHECVALARDVAEVLGNQLGIPVFLYEEAAVRPDRRTLAEVRQGEFEGLRERIGQDPERMPDFGPNRIHPTAGCTAVGARMPLVALNVQLGTTDLAIAKEIANALQGSTGGLAGCKAQGMALEERSQVQIALQLINYKETPIHRAFELIRIEAERYGVSIAGSEFVGLVPLDALVGVASHYLRLEGFNSDQVLEKRLMG